MKVIHCLGWYPPDSYGGTERYVESLVRELRLAGLPVEVMAARDGDEVVRYDHDECPVTRYPVPISRSRTQLRGDQPHDGFGEFRELLAAKRPEIYHQHSWTLGCGLHHLRAAYAMGIPSVLTIHVPGNICPNGTMMRDGEPCDGFIDAGRCTACQLKRRGAPRQIAAWACALPPGVSAHLAGLPGSVGTMLGMPSLIESHRQKLLEACRLAGKVVVVADWVRQALLANGVPDEHVVLSRHGLDGPPPHVPRPPRRDGPLRLGYLGRWDRVKGVDLLVHAVRGLDRSVDVDLCIRAMAQGDEGEQYRQEVIRLAGGDSRVRIQSPLDPNEVSAFLTEIDILAVPSRCLETGPLVVLESLAVGTPVLGSGIGGIKEWVMDGVNGWLLPHDDVDAWSAAIEGFAKVLPSVSVSAPARTMKQVASEMQAIYCSLMQEKEGAPA